MPKKKDNKAEEESKKIDNQEEKPKALEWRQLDKYIGKPIWDDREKKWRVLEGYKRMSNTLSITFSDITDWISFNDRFLYLEEVKINVRL